MAISFGGAILFAVFVGLGQYRIVSVLSDMLAIIFKPRIGTGKLGKAGQYCVHARKRVCSRESAPHLLRTLRPKKSESAVRSC